MANEELGSQQLYFPGRKIEALVVALVVASAQVKVVASVQMSVVALVLVSAQVSERE
jgi:hypothetical protein